MIIYLRGVNVDSSYSQFGVLLIILNVTAFSFGLLSGSWCLACWLTVIAYWDTWWNSATLNKISFHCALSALTSQDLPAGDGAQTSVTNTTGHFPLFQSRMVWCRIVQTQYNLVPPLMQVYLSHLHHGGQGQTAHMQLSMWLILWPEKPLSCTTDYLGGWIHAHVLVQRVWLWNCQVFLKLLVIFNVRHRDRFWCIRIG